MSDTELSSIPLALKMEKEPSKPPSCCSAITQEELYQIFAHKSTDLPNKCIYVDLFLHIVLSTFHKLTDK